MIKTENNKILKSKQPQLISEVFQSSYYEKMWLKTHGKQRYIAFSDHALTQLRKYFISLDQEKKGCIGIDELEDPFIAFGLSNNRQEVAELIKSVDLDGSGTIQFQQFLGIMLQIKKGRKIDTKNSAVFDFFQRMSQGKLVDGYDTDISFRMNVSQYRRKKILDSLMATQKQKRQHGSKIVNNFKNQIINHPKMKLMLAQVQKNIPLTLDVQVKQKKIKK